jgi:hypothetical protein
MTPNISLNADALWRPLRARAVTGQLTRWARRIATMLGWEFFVTREADQKTSRPLLASWQTGLGGTDWIDDLVAKGVATNLGGNGYPMRYAIPAGALGAVLQLGAPKHAGPPVIGDDCFLPSEWTGRVKIDIDRIRSLGASDVLIVEAWDQS